MQIRQKGGIVDESTDVDFSEVTDDIDVDDELLNEALDTELDDSQEKIQRPHKSLAWECFVKTDGHNEYQTCSYCGSQLKSDQGCTSSLLQHFRTKHPTEYRTAIMNRSAEVRYSKVKM